MGFTILFSSIPIGKLIATSFYDKNFYVAAIGKVSSILNPSDIQI